MIRRRPGLTVQRLAVGYQSPGCQTARGLRHLRIKICGITRVEDALAAACLGADAIGLNFHPPSPRYADPVAAGEILSRLPPFVDAVGVFVNRSLPEMIAAVEPLGRIGTLQWHGDASLREVPAAGSYRLISAFPLHDQTGLREVAAYLELCRARGRLPDAVLLDGQHAGQYGGTGMKAPWEALVGLETDVPVILAGGLNADNVAEAVRLVKPYAVDVASGVEGSPGHKDPKKLRRFIERAREAAVKYL